MPKSSSGIVGDREPHQNPVFMFLPSGGGKGGRTALSIPDSGTEDGHRLTTIPKINKIVHLSSVLPKKRGRPPPPPFRLPTEEEERLSEAGPSSSSLKAGTSSLSTSPLASSNSGINYGAFTSLKLKQNEVALLDSLKYVDDHDVINSQEAGRAINKDELEKHIRWIRKETPNLFWTGLGEGLNRLNKIDKNNRKPSQWIQVVYDAATNTAIKFMGRLESRVQPLDFIAGGREAEGRGMKDGIPGKKPGPKRFVRCLDFLKRLMTGILLGSEIQKIILQPDLEDLLDKFYYYGLRTVVCQLHTHANTDISTGDHDHDHTLPCEWCCEVPCNCKVISEGFRSANMALHSLGLMDELAGPRLFAVIKNEMKTKIEEIGTKNMDCSNFDVLMDWMHNSSCAWFVALYLKNEEGRVVTSPPPEYSKDLTTMMLDQYGMTIIKDLFSIIIEFPDSKPLLDDLKQCLNTVNLRFELVSNLKSSLERRLLNAGVNTSEILEAYIATVRALKYVDPTGILVQLVTPPVREYLKHREDTVRVILISLTEESGELSEELARNPTNPDKTCKQTYNDCKLWNPDPMDVPKDKDNLRQSDLIEAILSIYGSKTVFIDEYRALLADRLLRMPKPGSITREIKCLELLKLRFGEADLQKCEVMLKDVSDSQRLNTRFYEDDGAVLANEAVQVSGLVVSAQFWPSFKQEGLLLPDPVQAAIEKYTKAFEMIKGNRTLEWQKHIGTVKLEIEHGGSIVSYSVSPIQATIIWHFQEKEKWSLEELVKVTGTSSAYLSNRIGFWVSKGMIIHTGGGNYMLADSIHESSKATGVIPNKYVEEVDTDSPMASTSSQRATELQVFWSYIEAMLTNLESLPLARIHSMLKLFATVECSSEELQKFLDDKVSHNLLVYSAGQYQLPK